MHEEEYNRMNHYFKLGLRGPIFHLICDKVTVYWNHVRHLACAGEGIVVSVEKLIIGPQTSKEGIRGSEMSDNWLGLV